MLWQWFIEFGIKARNDPSAGSPTDTVLRLLHPLDDKAHDTSFQRTMREQRFNKSLCSLPDHPIG
jgi:hypothetical protein